MRRRDILFIIVCFFVLIITDVSLCIKLRKAQTSSSKEKSNLEEEYSSLFNTCAQLILLNGPQYLSLTKKLEQMTDENGIQVPLVYVLCEKNVCGSCLSLLMSELENFDIKKEDILFVLEETNRYVKDEIRANGFSNVLYDDAPFQDMDGDGHIVLSIIDDGHYEFFYYDVKDAPIFLNTFLGSIYNNKS